MRLLIGTLLLALSVAAGTDELVSGYTRKDGTYVDSYMRSDPKGTRATTTRPEGTPNPYTGERGYRSDDGYRSNDGWSSRRSRER